MKTITFYSYKGGVGRSLALANIATRLAEFGKKVCLVDFDLEAPGLHLKFQNEITQPIATGLVDYIYEYAHDGILPESIVNYSTRLKVYNNENIHLIPAGNIDSNDYWKKLSSIDWYNLVYENPNSISFFLDLKQKIKKELAPDFLLIDSRTGISEMSGITISLLADEVIVVSANNKENLTGSKRIIDFLIKEDSSVFGKTPKVSFVLSRIPTAETPQDKGREQLIVSKIRKDLASIKAENFFILHSDRDLEMNEEMRIGHDTDDIVNPTVKSVQITKEYLALFEHLTEGVLTAEEKVRFDNIKKSEKLYKEALNNPNYGKRIEILNKALELNPQNINVQILLGIANVNIGNVDTGMKILESILLVHPKQPSIIYATLGETYLNNNKTDKAIEIYNKMIELFPSESHVAFIGIGNIMYRTEQYEKAIEYYTIALQENPHLYAITYNGRANAYRNLGRYQQALDDVFKSLEIDPEFAIAYTTLAEIYAMQGKISEFYLNFEIALSKNRGVVAKSLPKEKVYSKFLKEERFINLLEKYDIPIPSYD